VARARAEAARRGLANVSFLIGDVERMPLAEHTFDVAVCRFAFHHFPRPAAVIAEMRRVTRRAARLVIVDMLASEDPARADYHNWLERLCDPSHARALPASEFERIFAEQDLDVIYKQTRKTTFTADEFIAHGAPSAATAARIRELMEAAIEGDRAGLSLRRQHGQLRLSHTGVSYVLRKRP